MKLSICLRFCFCALSSIFATAIHREFFKYWFVQDFWAIISVNFQINAKILLARLIIQNALDPIVFIDVIYYVNILKLIHAKYRDFLYNYKLVLNCVVCSFRVLAWFLSLYFLILKENLLPTARCWLKQNCFYIRRKIQIKSFGNWSLKIQKQSYELKCRRFSRCSKNANVESRAKWIRKKKSNFDKNFYVMNDVKRMQRMCYIKCAQQVVQNIFTSMWIAWAILFLLSSLQ